jgi:site-specific DNA-cytosine methylase
MENVTAIISLRQKLTLICFEKVRQWDLFGAKDNESVAGRYIRRVIEAKHSAALGYVLGDLAARGYDAKWICLRASDVGANHHRDRWWLLARSMADTNSELRRASWSGEVEAAPAITANTTSEQPTSMACKCDGNFRHSQHAEREAVSPLRGMDDGLASRPLQGWWEVEPNVGRVTDENDNRADQLKALGNGIVPLQGAVAYSMLSVLFDD